jgi:hypothetical protein
MRPLSGTLLFMGKTILCVAFALAVTADGAFSGAQTNPAGSLGRHPDFSGSWTLDRSLSVDPGTINLSPSTPGASQQQHRGRGGFGGGGGGGFGVSRRNASGAGTLTESEQKLLTSLTDQLKSASNSLAISHHDPSFVVNDAQNHTMFLQTDGSQTENHLADATIMSATHWDGTRIVAESPIGDRLTLVYTYTLLEATNQMVLRVTRKDGRDFEPNVKLVYQRSRT